MTDSDLIAAFLAKNADVTVPEGMRTTTPREMFNAVRGQTIDSQRIDAAERDKARRAYAQQTYLDQRIEDRCVIDHAGREHWMNAEGEWLS